MPCSLVDIYRCFGETSCPHLHGRTVSGVYKGGYRYRGKECWDRSLERTNRSNEDVEMTWPQFLCLSLCHFICAWITLLPWRWRQHVPTKIGNCLLDYTLSYPTRQYLLNRLGENRRSHIGYSGLEKQHRNFIMHNPLKSMGSAWSLFTVSISYSQFHDMCHSHDRHVRITHKIIQSSPANRRFDPSTIPQYIEVPKPIARAHAHWRCLQAQSRRPTILVAR
jgi:hypothetical protein